MLVLKYFSFILCLFSILFFINKFNKNLFKFLSLIIAILLSILITYSVYGLTLYNISNISLNDILYQFYSNVNSINQEHYSIIFTLIVLSYISTQTITLFFLQIKNLVIKKINN